MGKYYTPKRILDIIEPCAGSGKSLYEIVHNPPYYFGKPSLWQRFRAWLQRVADRVMP